MLPKMASAEDRREYQIIAQGGLDLTEKPTAGELSDSVGITTDSYPVVCQRKNRRTIASYARPTAVYYWNGLLVVDGTRLIYNGQVVGNVSEGEKQFAVVNTKLCIFPDKVFLDLNDLVVRQLSPEFRVAASTATFTEHGITISDSAPVISTETSSYPFSSGSPKYVKTYTALEWDSSTKEWAKTGEQEKLVQEVSDGDLLIPSISAAGAAEINVKENGAWSGTENDAGIYVKITGHSKSSVTTERQWEKFNCVSSEYTYFLKKRIASGLLDSFQPSWLYDLSDTWTVDYYTGRVNRTGVSAILLRNGIGMYTPEGKRITSVTESEMLFTYDLYDVVQYSGVEESQGAKSYGLVRGAPGTYPENGRAADGYWYVDRGETGFDGTETLNFDLCDASGANGIFTNYFSVGDRVRISGAVTLPENNTPENNVVTIETVDGYTMTFAETFAEGSEAGEIIISKPIPDLDYICSSDNRLWGVCSKDNTIYASAQGRPGDFYDYDGLDTDSWAVAVGTDRNFTGIAAYGDAVLCWKENCLHKVMGNNPSEYYMSTYTVNGVENGSNLSVQVINEVLYYKGIDGVYAYTGGVPALISPQFGTHRYRYAAAGSDDMHYYISMQRTDGSKWELFIFDILHGLWMKEDEIRCTSFTEQDGKVVFLSDGIIYMAGQENDEVVSWMAEYAPIYEINSSGYGSSGSLNRRDYLRLLIRVEVNGTLVVEYRTDDGEWKTAKHVSTDWTKIVTVPLPPIRCDKFQFRLSGEGKVTIRAVEREMTIGSKK